MKTAKNNGISLCEAVAKDYVRVFPYEKPVYYICALFIIAAFITFISVICSNFFVGTAVFLPAVVIAKTIGRVWQSDTSTCFCKIVTSRKAVQIIICKVG